MLDAVGRARARATGRSTATGGRVSVFPNLAGLYRYLAERDAGGDGDCVMLEFEGELTGDRDLDADAGALLIRPTRIVARHPFDHERFEARRAEHSRA